MTKLYKIKIGMVNYLMMKLSLLLPLKKKKIKNKKIIIKKKGNYYNKKLYFNCKYIYIFCRYTFLQGAIFPNILTYISIDYWHRNWNLSPLQWV